ncbi:NAD-dependent epimerase/dehydratase family protein [Kibdelosporangium persicum]|uniref:Nucleoside-diphosphate sugar epimerase n=1 Tax=Kibdelosporangium persicum TaxID=2698649 RepID=A0ABX2F7R6_9PSEU|nr:NAD-dependent epimerase/dehydratase family protein [Kibdelosporangium persicum]NRN66840.1 Nucleoside-diphosphate sugar epimerase [Kibdelosporangium persicum]
MKVVVTGASGNIGAALLRDHPWCAVGVSRRRPETNLPYVECDIGGPTAVAQLTEAFAGADAVVHLAWAIHPRTTEPDMWRTNLGGTTNVLRAVVAAGVPHFVCASSVAAYASADRWRFVTENWPCTGVRGSAYSLGKSVLESQLDAFERRHPGVKVARIRPCGVVQGSSAATFRGWLLSPLVPTSLIGRRWLPVPLWTGMRLQLVHSEDVADALRLIVEHGAVGAFNLAAEPVLDADEIAGRFGGRRVPVPLGVLTAAAWATWRAGLQPLHPGWVRLADQASLVDSAKARTELGWTARHDPFGTLDELVGAMRSLGRAPYRIRPGRPSHQSQSP